MIDPYMYCPDCMPNPCSCRAEAPEPVTKVSIRYLCGCTVEEMVYGTPGEVANYIIQAGARLCYRCQHKTPNDWFRKLALAQERYYS